QIIDFLSGSYIHHALTVNPHVYISCIKRFWNTAVVKRSDDVTRLQALVDKKRIVISEEVVREILQLNDAEGVVCLPNEEIFAGLAQAQIPAQDDDVQEHAEEEVATDVVSSTPTSPSPSPSSPTANAAQQLEIIKLKARVKKLERLNKVKSSKLRRLKKVGTSQRIESSDDIENVFNQGRISVDMETDEGIELEEDTEVQEAVEVVTTAKLITEFVNAAATQVAAASTHISAAKPKVLKIAAALTVSTRKRKGVVIRDLEEELHIDTPAETLTVKDKGKGILIEDPKPMKKKDQVEMDAEYAKKLQEELNKEHEEAYKKIDWNAAFDYNTEGYKMKFFKGKTYDQILPIFQARFDANLKFLFKTREEMEKEDEEIIKSINETLAHKAAKRRKLSEEAQEADDLRRRLEIVQDEDDDVFVEAIPLAQKVSVVDYQVVVIDNKPNIGEEMEAADFMWCTCDYSINSSALLID
nr:hypothetical protein [Tanacetum cinerariifolium]